ncbi:MAG: hypothetical protein Q9224_004740, partial [Gallowayella concinna]
IAHLRSGGGTDFYESLRGGQTTFHGPGQLTAFLILNLKTHGLTSRVYVEFLETSVIATLAHYGIIGTRTENPGVWTSNGKKIASVGVHLRRYITGFGIGLNVDTNLEWFERIVMCGLPEKKATNFEGEGVKGVEVEEVGRVFAEIVAKGLRSVDGIEQVGEREAVGA